MRHRKSNIKLGRTASHRDAMLRNMLTSLFEFERITTTLSKAKALRPLADRMIALAKNGKADLHSFRQAAAVLTKRSVLDKIFEEAPERFSDRNSGYTIMVKTGHRQGDAAPMAIVELCKAGQAKANIGGGTQGGAAPKLKASSGDRSKRVAQSAVKNVSAAEETTAVEEAAETEKDAFEAPQDDEKTE